jgi:hypothetical protein
MTTPDHECLVPGCRQRFTNGEAAARHYLHSHAKPGRWSA